MPLLQPEIIFKTAEKLQTAPQILPRLQGMLNNPNSTLEDVVQLIRLDASLSARVVRVARSPFFAGPKTGASIESAVARLGFSEVHRIVNGILASQLMGQALAIYQLKKGELFQNSLVAGLLMEELAPQLDLHKPDAYTIGLFHAIGKLVINQFARQHDMVFYHESAGADEGISPAWEKQILGFDHAEAGALLLEHWTLPEEIVRPIKYQLEPAGSPREPAVAALLQLVVRCLPIIDKAPAGGNLLGESLQELPADIEAARSSRLMHVEGVEQAVAVVRAKLIKLATAFG